jgi:hypothetical protein
MDLKSRAIGESTREMTSLRSTHKSVEQERTEETERPKTLSSFSVVAVSSCSSLGCGQRPRWILRVLWVLCGYCVSTEVCSASNIRTWAFEATIVSNDDPLFKAADVRLGDTIRGTFSFDLSLAADPDDDPDYASYTYPPAFQGIQLAIENPRTGTRLEYFPLIDDDNEYWLEVYTSDAANDADDETWMSFYQVPVPPDPSWFDFIVMNFVRPGLVADLAVPTEIRLNEWPLAFIWIWADQADVDGITAEIHTITPVVPGDFNFDAVVDARDYASWRSSYGLSGYSDADANRDGTVGTADYVIWRNSFRPDDMVGPGVNAAVPEPDAAWLLFTGFTALFRIRRSRRRISCDPRNTIKIRVIAGQLGQTFCLHDSRHQRVAAQ